MVAETTGSENNDEFYNDNGHIAKRTNHSGGVLGGMSDGRDIIFRTAIKPTPSISSLQSTVSRNGDEMQVCIKGRHDPVIVPRAVVVVETMTACTILDLLMANMTSRMDYLKKVYDK